MTDHIRKAHPDHIALRGIDVRYFGNLLILVKAAARTKVLPLSPTELLWVMRMEKLANRAEIIDIENEPELPRLEPEPEVLPAIDVEPSSVPCQVCGEPITSATAKTHDCSALPVFEDDGGYTGPVHD